MKFLIVDQITLTKTLNKITSKFNKGEQFYINIEELKEKRSNPQLRYYWAIISVIQESLNEQGNNLSQEETSNEMKRQFFYKIAKINNQEVKVLKSVANNSETNIKEMREFIDNIVNWCNKWNIIIPRCDKDYSFHERYL
jgi:hypothetical protein